MKAKVLPLSGKYYGTLVGIIYDNNKEFTDNPRVPEFCNSDNVIEVWINDDSGPSERELEGYTKKEDGKWYITEDGHEYEYEIWDSHYETATSLKISNVIVEAINKMGEDG